MGYISAKKVQLEKNLEYLFPYKDFFCPYIVSNVHILSNWFLWNILYDWYMHVNEITANQIIHCVILLSVYFDCSSPIWHFLLISSGDTDDWRPSDWNVFSCLTYCNLIPNWDTFLGIDLTFNVIVNLYDRVMMSYRCWFSGSFSESPTKSKLLLES